ncbi:MCE family protein [Mycolicibacterium sphagni]|uniref:Mammalian cell entry protein n=1 Tax=Mycolicibacterium sphagni TaxID=1786 RepID=A0A255DBD9_9MYCO|nr:MCE family protein [Mycolicibacterium sphagni]MCV7175370.1 MCE family protein [Mycolicibacterium sphagni]OYN76696.1 mammalian cell entry protein [Mycolicibacterium sphagni]
MRSQWLTRGLVAVFAVLIAVGATIVVRNAFFGPTTITAYFASATAIYPGDDVRVSGVKVGTITAIDPQGQQAKMTLRVDHGVAIPADAKAVVVAQNLIAARYVQLTPAYTTTGQTMADGAVIPRDRTAVPVEWDEVKAQLMRLATDLGPKAGTDTTSVARFIDSAADALDGNGDKLRATLGQLSTIARVLASGSGNIVDIITNLQVFVTALHDSNTQIVQFEDRLATLTSVLDNSRSDLDAALTYLSAAVGDVQSFIADTRDKTAEQIRSLAAVTQNLADHKMDLENVLHVAPNAFGNQYNIYGPDNGAPLGAFVFNNFSNPVQFICSIIGAVQNTTADATAKACSQYLGPALRLLNFDYLPFPVNPYLMKSTDPDKLIYTDPKLAPAGSGPQPGPVEEPPAISAYTGLNGDVPAPPGLGQPPAVAPGSSAPDHLPASPSPALFPGAPVPQGAPPGPAPAANLPAMLLPAEGSTP